MVDLLVPVHPTGRPSPPVFSVLRIVQGVLSPTGPRHLFSASEVASGIVGSWTYGAWVWPSGDIRICSGASRRYACYLQETSGMVRSSSVANKVTTIVQLIKTESCHTRVYIAETGILVCPSFIMKNTFVSFLRRFPQELSACIYCE